MKSRFGLHRSRGVVFKLSALFSIDAFAGGFVLQSIVAYWFHVRFHVQPALLGGIFFGANILAGLSALSAAWVASKIGLVRTMVFTHIPSNILLILVPLMPNLPLAITMLLLRFSISQMDVPTRQSYTMAVVNPDERSAAAGITGIARTTGASLAHRPSPRPCSSIERSLLPVWQPEDRVRPAPVPQFSSDKTSGGKGKPPLRKKITG
jgi:MFS family permease